jgi:hypothetical protein
MKRLVAAALVATFALVAAGPAIGSQAIPASARIAKKCKKKHGKKCKKKAPTPVVSTPTPPAPPAPLALNAREVIDRVTQKAKEYCDRDPSCFDYGYYYDGTPDNPDCVLRTTYMWICDGLKDIDAGTELEECAFREVVERDGYNGIKSRQDPFYAWHCAPLTN